MKFTYAIIKKTEALSAQVKGVIMTLMVHTPEGTTKTAEGKALTFADVAAIPLPAQTRSYTPVGHGDYIRLIEDRAERLLGVTPTNLQLGLSRKGQQLFGTMRLGGGDDEKAPIVGFRNSYDKSLSAGLCAGSQVFVCDNLCFSADGVVVMRKHSRFVWRDLQDIVDSAIRNVSNVFDQFQGQVDALKSIPVGFDDGFGYIGIARGHNYLTPNQESVAIQDWITPRHEEFSERNAWSLYNCFTEGLKKGSAGGSMDRHTAVHDFFLKRFMS